MVSCLRVSTRRELTREVFSGYYEGQSAQEVRNGEWRIGSLVICCVCQRLLFFPVGRATRQVQEEEKVRVGQAASDDQVSAFHQSHRNESILTTSFSTGLELGVSTPCVLVEETSSTALCVSSPATSRGRPSTPPARPELLVSFTTLPTTSLSEPTPSSSRPSSRSTLHLSGSGTRPTTRSP